MKAYFLAFIVLFGIITLSACNKKQGCTDPKALNLDTSAEETNNDICQYSTTTFYASGNAFSGDEVNEIVITLGQNGDTIGVISTFNQAIPDDCATTGTVQYTFKTGNTQVWFATYKLVAGGVVTNQGDFAPSSSEACIKIDVLP